MSGTPSGPPVSRRAVLRAGTGFAGLAAAATLTSCGEVSAPPAALVARRAMPNADQTALSAAGQSAARLLTAVTDLARSRPDLAALLEAIGSDHRAQLAALGAGASASPAPGPSGQRDGGAAVQALVSAETAAAQEALDAVGTVSPGVAALLARIAAARAAHADLLAAAAKLRAPGVLRTSASATSGAGGIPSSAPGPSTPPTGPELGASGTPSPRGTAASARTASLSDAAGAALMALTAGEHAAVYAYGAVVARVAPPDRARARDAWAWHTARRDVLEERLLAAGMQPPVAAPAYDLGGTLSTARAAALAATVEDRLTTLDARTVAAGSGADRSDAAEGLVAGARRAAAWRGRPEALPG